MLRSQFRGTEKAEFRTMLKTHRPGELRRAEVLNTPSWSTPGRMVIIAIHVTEASLGYCARPRIFTGKSAGKGACGSA